MNAPDIHSLTGAYAVDALDDDERLAFEEHLAQCAACQTEVADLREAASLLPSTLATTPPPGLRAAILGQATTVRPLPPPIPAPGRRPHGRLLAAAAAVLVLAGGGGAVVWQQTHFSSTPSAADRVLQARDARRVSVDLTGGASATVYRSVSQHRAVLVTRGLPAAPAGRVYELWLQRDGRMVPAGLLRSAGDQVVLLSGDASEATAAGITVEPPGGSPAPTTTPIALFDLRAAT